MIKERLSVGKAQAQPIDQTIRSILANYRSTVQATTGKTPSELMIGRNITMPLDLLAIKPLQQKKVHFADDVEQHVAKQQNRYKTYADQRRRAKPSNLQVGHDVRVKTQVRHNKLDPVWGAPFKVISQPSKDTVKLDNGSTWNASLLMRDKENPQVPPPRSPNKPHHSHNKQQETMAMQEQDASDESAPSQTRAALDAEHQRHMLREFREAEERTEPPDEQPPEPPPLRRSTREHHPPDRFADNYYY